MCCHAHLLHPHHTLGCHLPFSHIHLNMLMISLFTRIFPLLYYIIRAPHHTYLHPHINLDHIYVYNLCPVIRSTSCLWLPPLILVFAHTQPLLSLHTWHTSWAITDPLFWPQGTTRSLPLLSFISSLLNPLPISTTGTAQDMHNNSTPKSSSFPSYITTLKELGDI